MLVAMSSQPTAGRSVLDVHGEVDVSTVTQLAEALATVFLSPIKQVVVDLTHTSFMDSTGVRELARTARQAHKDGRAVQVVCPLENRPVRLLFELVKLDQVVPVLERLPPDASIGSVDEEGTS